jgi:hypothetical protein
MRYTEDMDGWMDKDDACSKYVCFRTYSFIQYMLGTIFIQAFKLFIGIWQEYSQEILLKLYQTFIIFSVGTRKKFPNF